ncbi:hypothetical protein LAZ67_8001514 [Cordylochernes scorpioides]|uniref:Uncharacterized protein n=1 Tax=Cordylochernes scorpioides TaxID=51811 RepID=A0ABY6KQC3_9ARAC|nr:hypothetical protein LAZ67_8001514 [Cordylochernes scorpioides]
MSEIHRIYLRMKKMKQLARIRILERHRQIYRVLTQNLNGIKSKYVGTPTDFLCFILIILRILITLSNYFSASFRHMNIHMSWYLTMPQFL